MSRPIFLLSVCVPTYNRAMQLEKLLNSVSKIDCIEIVICDDGSVDNTVEIIDRYRDKIRINYSYQENQGVSKAIKTAYEKSNGIFLIKMDSDDVFLKNGCEQIISTLKKYYLVHKAFVFGIEAISVNGKKTINNPGEGVSNFISLRADKLIKGDLKEVVHREVILEQMYKVERGVRRVPPSLLWVKIAEKYNCLCCPTIVAKKEYMTSGITDQILSYTIKYPKPMVELYERLTSSKKYKSSFYRWRCYLLLGRYSLHAKIIHCSDWRTLIIIPFAYLIYIFDNYRILRKNK